MRVWKRRRWRSVMLRLGYLIYMYVKVIFGLDLLIVMNSCIRFKETVKIVLF